MREIGSTYVANTKRRLIIGCISLLVGLPAVACCLTLIFTVLLPALDKIPAGGNPNTGIYVLLGIGLVVLVGLIAIPLGIFVVMTVRRARALDAIFTPLGLSGSVYMLNGRHYQGKIGGREADVYIYRGPTVEIRLQTAVQTRIVAVSKGSLPTSVAWIFNKKPIATDNTPLAAYSIFPLDQIWAGNLVTDPRATEAIQTLMTMGADWAIFRRVEIQPGEVLLYLNRSRSVFGSSLNLNAAQIWLDALKSLAQAAESQPAPEITEAPVNATSRQSRQKTNKFLIAAIVLIVFGMPLCFVSIGVIAYLIVSFLG